MSVYSCAPLLFAKSPKTLLGFFISFFLCFIPFRECLFQKQGLPGPLIWCRDHKGGLLCALPGRFEDWVFKEKIRVK